MEGDRGGAGPPREQIERARECAGVGPGVVVEDEDRLTRGRGDAPVEPFDTQVRARGDDFDAGEFALEGRGCAVGRGVVHDDDLAVLADVVGFEHAERVREFLDSVTRQDDDR